MTTQHKNLRQKIWIRCCECDAEQEVFTNEFDDGLAWCNDCQETREHEQIEKPSSTRSAERVTEA
jgi:hypothetical protein